MADTTDKRPDRALVARINAIIAKEPGATLEQALQQLQQAKAGEPGFGFWQDYLEWKVGNEQQGIAVRDDALEAEARKLEIHDAMRAQIDTAVEEQQRAEAVRKNQRANGIAASATEREHTRILAAEASHKLAAAVEAYMAEHNLHGLKGQEQAKAYLRLHRPELFADYAALELAAKTAPSGLIHERS